ncbi:hypothetical protein ACVA51_10840 [Pseudomonas luteola]
MSTQKRKVETDRFEAESESGEVYLIIEETTQTGFTNLDTGKTSWKNGSVEYRTSEFEPVNPISDTKFELFESEEILTRI